jgi:L-amino acid N-acyltransferase YncA
MQPLGDQAVAIHAMAEQDWAGVRAIYLEGIATGHATFEKSAPDWDVWNASHLPFCRFVARSGSELLGWAALSPVSNRCVYGGVAEVSIYVALHARGRKIGSKLLVALIEVSERNGI